jgi:beta-galactosidase
MDHPGVRGADLSFYAALAERAKRSPAFAGWDLWSEPHVINWANPTYIPNPEFCFCPNTLRKFRGWLGKKYGDIGALNQAWYRRYETWEDVEPGRMSTILSYTDYIDWKAFLAEKLGEDLHDRYRAVKAVVPDAVATSHAAGVGLFASPHHWEGQPDDWTMAAQVDYYGTSFYPKHSAGVDRDPQWRGALLDFTRSFGYGAGKRDGFYVGELQGGFGTIALNVSPAVTPEDLRVWMWSALARGARGVNVYAYYPMSSGYESGGFGLINLDGTITDRAKVAGSVARVVDANQKLFLQARPLKAQVAVVYNPLSHFVGGRQRAAAYGGPQGEVAGIERDSLLGIYRALWSRNVPLDFVHIGHLSAENLRQYKLVVLPYPLMLPESSAGVLKEYVRGGGVLVSEARLGWSNERAYASDRIPGLGLWEMTGCREVAVETAPKERTAIRWTGDMLPGLDTGSVIPGRWYQEALEPLRPDARVVAEFADGRPAAVLAPYGRGKSLMLGSYVSAAYQSAPSAEAERFFAGLLRWAGVEEPIDAGASGLEVRALESGPDVLVFAFNHGKAPADASLALRLAASRRVSGVDLVTGQAVAVSTEGGRVQLPRRRIGAMDVWVVRLTPAN